MLPGQEVIFPHWIEGISFLCFSVLRPPPGNREGNHSQSHTKLPLSRHLQSPCLFSSKTDFRFPLRPAVRETRFFLRLTGCIWLTKGARSGASIPFFLPCLLHFASLFFRPSAISEWACESIGRSWSFYVPELFAFYLWLLRRTFSISASLCGTTNPDFLQ